MDSILFERQEAALCAQHALNMLLQNHLFSVEELSEIARRLDHQENRMLDADLQNRESQNMNESGFFSIQVISEALKAFDLELHSIKHPSMVEYKENPTKAKAYLCNHNQHWFVLRRFGEQWFELNSMKKGPRLMSDTFVGVYLHQLDAEGYSIFVVQGILPDSEADQLILLCPVEPPSNQLQERKEPNIVQKVFNTVGKKLGGALLPSSSQDSNEDRDLAIAMAMSMETSGETVGDRRDEDEISAAILASLKDLEKDHTEKIVPSAPVMSPENENVSIVTPEAEETPILRISSERSSTDDVSKTTETLSIGNKNAPKPGKTPSPEQQRKDREEFLKRFEEKK